MKKHDYQNTIHAFTSDYNTCTCNKWEINQEMELSPDYV